MERRAELAELLDAARDARAGNGRLVLVAGEAGVGKSALVAAAAQAMPDAPWWWGACDGQFTPRPLGALIDIAEQVGGPLAQLVGEQAPRTDLFAGLLAILREAPLTVLVIEDVHWADEATLDLLRFVARRLRGLPCLVIVTYRDDALDADGPLRVALGDLSTQHGTRRVELRPLSVAAVRDLARGSTLDPVEVHRLTGGNAFFVTELINSASTDLPRSVSDVVLARAARLSPEARGALEIAALLGGRMDPRLLAKAGVDGIDVDELVAAGLLVGDTTSVRYRHELGRVAIDAALGPSRRRDVHRTVLEALQALGLDDEARLAHHAEGAGDAAAVARYAPAAARRASVLGAHREAVAQYQRALRCAPADDRAVATLYDALATELTYVDRWEEAAGARTAALDLWRRLDEPLRVGDDLRRLATVMWRLVRGAETVSCVAEAVTVLEPFGPTPELGWAYAGRAIDAPDLETFAAGLDRARHLAVELGLTDLLGYVLVAEAELAFRRGDDWEAPLRRALALGLEHHLDQLVGSAHSSRYELFVLSYRFAEGERDFADGVSFCDDRQLDTYSSCLRGRRALALTELGRWDEALSLADGVLAITASPVNRLTSQVAAGLVRMRRGDAGVDELLDVAMRSADTLGETPWIVLTRLARAERCWLADDLAGAATEVGVAAASLGSMFPVHTAAVAVWQHRLGLAAGAAPVPVATWEERGCPYEAALALIEAGGEAELRDALARLDQLGAVAAASLVRRRLRAGGHRSIPAGPHPATRSHPLGLTRRQHDVLDLLCAGLTNDEIARRLYISAKTVDHHVSAVLAKLGAANRREAARIAVERGLLATADAGSPRRSR